MTTEVPALRIVDDATWDLAQQRLSRIREHTGANRPDRPPFWQQRRATTLLTNKIFCGCCGGALARNGKDYLTCNKARRQLTCDNNQSLRASKLEGLILDALRDHLMQPDLLAEFSAAFTATWTELQAEQSAGRDQIKRDREKNQRKIDELVEAITEGMRSPALTRKLAELEQRQDQLERQCSTTPPAVIRLPPNLAALYREKLNDLRAELSDPNNMAALELARSLITRITVSPGETPQQLEIDLEGALPALLALGQGANRDMPSNSLKELIYNDSFISSVKVVAGARYHLDLLLSG